MDSKKIYLTKEGLQELKKEFEELSKVKRPDVLSRVSQARSMGDLSENAEYVAARDELSFIDGRIDELEELLKEADEILTIPKFGRAESLNVSIACGVVLNALKF